MAYLVILLSKYICIGEEKESLKFDSGEEIKPGTECTYLGTKIDQTGYNTTEIKHRMYLFRHKDRPDGR